jgi:lipid-A-disaccharide synthase
MTEATPGIDPDCGVADDFPHVCLVAGEHSGDHMAGLLMKALADRLDGRVRFSGVGGGEMIAAGGDKGFDSFFPMEEIAIAGIFEIIPHIPNVLRRINQSAERIKALKPDVVITIDSPEFSFRLGNKLSRTNILHVHYVAPTVWAWRPKRAKMISGFLEHLLTILPFEAPYFEKWGLDCTFVGNPVVEMNLDQGDGPGFRKKHGLGRDQLVLSVLPGSRLSEVRSLLPIFKQAVDIIKRRVPDLAVVVPTVGTVADEVKAAVSDWPVPVIVTETINAKRDVFAASNVALAASGTVTSELAMAGVPMVIAYRVAPLSALLIRMMTKVKYVSIVNMVLGREVSPEFIQENCTGPKIAKALGDLLCDADALRAQRDALADVGDKLGRHLAPSSETAAGVILKILEKKNAL